MPGVRVSGNGRGLEPPARQQASRLIISTGAPKNSVEVPPRYVARTINADDLPGAKREEALECDPEIAKRDEAPGCG